MERHSEQSRGGAPNAKLLYDYPGAAALLSMTPEALRNLVYRGRGPITTKIGARTFFSYKDLEAFVDKHRQGPPH